MIKKTSNGVYTLIKGVFLAFIVINSVAIAQASEIEDGKNLFNQNCVFCHQPDAIGKVGFAPSLTNHELLSISSDKFLLGTIRDGRLGTGMPPFSYLGKEGITSIVSYLKSFATVPNISAKVDALPAAKGDDKSGHALFDQICSTCHGVKGDGYLSGGTGTAIGNKSFLSKASDGFLRTTIANGRSNTRMLPFSGSEGLANLTAQEIDDIIVYLRQLSATQ